MVEGRAQLIGEPPAIIPLDRVFVIAAHRPDAAKAELLARQQARARALHDAMHPPRGVGGELRRAIEANLAVDIVCRRPRAAAAGALECLRRVVSRQVAGADDEACDRARRAEAILDRAAILEHDLIDLAHALADARAAELEIVVRALEVGSDADFVKARFRAEEGNAVAD